MKRKPGYGWLQLRRFCSLALLIFVIGCSNIPEAASPLEPSEPTPTIFGAFNEVDGVSILSTDPSEPSAVAPTVSSFFSAPQLSSPTPRITVTPVIVTPETTEQPTQAESSLMLPGAEFDTIPVFLDEINPDWAVSNSTSVEIKETNFPEPYEGDTVLSIKPYHDFGKLFFTVENDSRINYDRSKVFGISMWINGGDNYINLSDLAVTVVGSNANTYWIAEDRSVPALENGELPFSETRLYFLGFNYNIPPNTWVEIRVWLNDLLFDPYYNYVTGFYIKNDKGYRNTFYIDNVNLLMLEGNGEPAEKSSETLTPEEEEGLSSTPVLTETVSPKETLTP